MDPELLEQLEDPRAYPSRPTSVRLRQTHISVVCMVGDLVYKPKKHVSLPFVDFSTLALRERFCHEELRLNRRLCPGIYLDVVPL